LDDVSGSTRSSFHPVARTNDFNVGLEPRGVVLFLDFGTEPPLYVLCFLSSASLLIFFHFL
jgi:hypothetical protein